MNEKYLRWKTKKDVIFSWPQTCLYHAESIGEEKAKNKRLPGSAIMPRVGAAKSRPEVRGQRSDSKKDAARASHPGRICSWMFACFFHRAKAMRLRSPDAIPKDHFP